MDLSLTAPIHSGKLRNEESNAIFLFLNKLI